jgi:hypothetical protein
VKSVISDLRSDLAVAPKSQSFVVNAKLLGGYFEEMFLEGWYSCLEAAKDAMENI